jgi:hypothetical protein
MSIFHSCCTPCIQQPVSHNLLSCAHHRCCCRLFGWTPANEIGNGRWVMFGVFVGLLTEYATGVDFPNQIALLLSYLGIVDVE